MRPRALAWHISAFRELDHLPLTQRASSCWSESGLPLMIGQRSTEGLASSLMRE